MNIEGVVHNLSVILQATAMCIRVEYEHSERW